MSDDYSAERADELVAILRADLSDSLAWEVLEHIHSLSYEIEQHRAAMAELGRRRAGLVQELNDRGWGYGRIAKMLGVSKSRVQQLAANRRLGERCSP